MFVHTVYFWLKPGVSKTDRARFEKSLRTLTTIDGLVHCWIGRASSTERTVIDSTYDFGLITVFCDRAGHDHYQEAPVHLAFVADCARFWRKVTVYDTVESPKLDDVAGKSGTKTKGR